MSISIIVYLTKDSAGSRCESVSSSDPARHFSQPGRKKGEKVVKAVPERGVLENAAFTTFTGFNLLGARKCRRE